MIKERRNFTDEFKLEVARMVVGCPNGMQGYEAGCHGDAALGRSIQGRAAVAPASASSPPLAAVSMRAMNKYQGLLK